LTKGEARPAAAITKRSLLVAGHATSISLEDAFWSALKAAARRRGLSIAALVAVIDEERGAANLSSAIRVFLLREASDRPRPDDAPRDR
jgi:predicted DNA-binding ribbon-helix-helix protein